MDTFKQNLRLKIKNIYYKSKCDTLLESYDFAEFKSDARKQIWQPILKCKILD